MSKTITIPDDRGSRVYVTINGRDYVYTAGETVTVTDEVAALFENNEVNGVSHGRRAVAPLEAPVRQTGEGGIPIHVDDDGNLFGDGGASIQAIYVEGHKVIVPQTEE